MDGSPGRWEGTAAQSKSDSPRRRDLCVPVLVCSSCLINLRLCSGLMLKKLDKKLERTLLHSYFKDLRLQISSEIDSVALLSKVIALLYLQVHNKALQAPGRAISAALSRLKDKGPDSTFKILTDYHTATVTLLALLSAATGEEDDCTSDRILSKRELLESKMLQLKGLVLGNTNS